MAYKKDQGRMIRMAAFWSLAVLALYGCLSLRAELTTMSDALGKSLVPGMRKVPILGIVPSGAMLIALTLFGTVIYFLNRWLNKPRQADLLIDTEQELKKVTWPTLDETINGSFIVIVFVIFLMAFLAGADYLLARIARRVLLG